MKMELFLLVLMRSLHQQMLPEVQLKDILTSQVKPIRLTQAIIIKSILSLMMKMRLILRLNGLKKKKAILM